MRIAATDSTLQERVGQMLLGSWRVRDLDREVEPLSGGLAWAARLVALTLVDCVEVAGFARSPGGGKRWYALLCLDPGCASRPLPRPEEHAVVELPSRRMATAVRELRAAVGILAPVVGAPPSGRTWEEELHLTMLDAEALGKRLARLGRAASGRSARSVAELAVRAAHLAEGLETVAEGD